MWVAKVKGIWNGPQTVFETLAGSFAGTSAVADEGCHGQTWKDEDKMLRPERHLSLESSAPVETVAQLPWVIAMVALCLRPVATDVLVGLPADERLFRPRKEGVLLSERERRSWVA